MKITQLRLAKLLGRDGVTPATHVLDATIPGRPPGGPRRASRCGSKRRRGRVGAGGPGDDRPRRAAAAGAVNPAIRPGGGGEPGVYRMTFGSGAYFQALGSATFYPEVSITFEMTERAGHYHVPLLLSPFAYSTYRGS